MERPGAGGYLAARRLLITADAGGSNGYQARAWKAGLAALAGKPGLEITCCHFPPGTSKWNKIEHRLFARITMNWRSRPLASHDIIVNCIAATATRTGLRVTAELDDGPYPAGTKISDAQMNDLKPAVTHYWHGEWNYTLHPRPARGCRARSPAARRTPAGSGLARLPRHHRHDRPRPGRPGRPPWPRPEPAARGRSCTAAAARPRRQPPGTGRPPRITLTTKLLAAILRDRHGLPCKAIAALLEVARPHQPRRPPHPRLLTERGITTPARTGQAPPPSPTSAATPPQQESPSPPRSNQRVNNLRVAYRSTDEASVPFDPEPGT